MVPERARTISPIRRNGIGVWPILFQGQNGGVRKQYHFWPGETGLDAWDVDRLVYLSKDLPVREIALDSIDEIDTNYWFDFGPIDPTVRRVVEHIRLVQDADLSYPIILGVMDGSWTECIGLRVPF